MITSDSRDDFFKVGLVVLADRASNADNDFVKTFGALPQVADPELVRRPDFWHFGASIEVWMDAAGVVVWLHFEEVMTVVLWSIEALTSNTDWL